VQEKFSHLADISFSLGIPRMILAAVIVFFGLFPSVLFDVIDSAAVPFMRGLP
jgi:NADH-quinone oxidoreductase subunit M